MGELKYLELEIARKMYLCPEKSIEKVVLVNRGEIYGSPLGPEHLKFLYPCGEEVMPVFDLGIVSQGPYFVVVVLKKLLDLAGLAVDSVRSFIELSGELLETAVEVPAFLSSRALTLNGSEYYFLNIDALFEGKE